MTRPSRFLPVSDVGTGLYDWPTVSLGLARAYVKAGDRHEAAQEYVRILQLAPDQPEARRELGRLGRAP